MKFSEQWLRGWVSPQVDRDELVARLSMAGLEVDSVTPAAGVFSGVVVGEVLSTEQHPDADKLRVCQVSNGTETFQVVCGAPNVRPGLKIPFAMIGAELPGDFKIKKAKLRGVESNGMLCSQAELQVGEGNDGLMELPADAPVGQDVRVYLALEDASIEVDLTPNRGDCRPSLAWPVKSARCTTFQSPAPWLPQSLPCTRKCARLKCWRPTLAHATWAV